MAFFFETNKQAWEFKINPSFRILKLLSFKVFPVEVISVIISEDPINLKQVVNTNKCLIHLLKHNKKLLITSTIDNLIKGASGQAIHNMNLMFGFKETEGLNLKATYF